MSEEPEDDGEQDRSRDRPERTEPHRVELDPDVAPDQSKEQVAILPHLPHLHQERDR
jgi:hypothetical protein